MAGLGVLYKALNLKQRTGQKKKNQSSHSMHACEVVKKILNFEAYMLKVGKSNGLMFTPLRCPPKKKQFYNLAIHSGTIGSSGLENKKPKLMFTPVSL